MSISTDICGHPAPVGMRDANKAGVRKTNLCLNSDANESSGGGAPATPPTAQSNAVVTPPPEPTAPPPPPAAMTVVTGEVTEEVLLLRHQLAEKERLIKERETEVATVKDTHERYRQSVEAGTPIPVKPGKTETKRRVLFVRR